MTARFTRLLAIPALAASVVWFLGGPLPQCIGGVGPSGDAGRAVCAAQWRAALPPFEQFRYDHPWVVPVIAFLLALALVHAGEVVIERRGRSTR